MTPKKLNLYAKGKKIERENKDLDIWLAVGRYIIPAIKLGVREGAWGKDNLEYPQEPLYKNLNKTENTEEELQKQREAFALDMKIRKANWDLAHPKNKESEV